MLCLSVVQESDQIQEPRPTSLMTSRSSQAKELSAPTPASTPVAGATSRFQMGHSEKTADPAVGKQEDAASGGAPDKPLTSAFAGATPIESAPESERTSLSGGPAGSGMESRKVTKTPSQLLKMGLGMDKWWPSKKPSQALEGEAPAPTAAAGAEAAPQPDAREEGKGKPAAGGHVVEMSADSRGAPGLPAADGSTPVAWTAHSSGQATSISEKPLAEHAPPKARFSKSMVGHDAGGKNKGSWRSQVAGLAVAGLKLALLAAVGAAGAHGYCEGRQHLNKRTQAALSLVLSASATIDKYPAYSEAFAQAAARHAARQQENADPLVTSSVLSPPPSVIPNTNSTTRLLPGRQEGDSMAGSTSIGRGVGMGPTPAAGISSGYPPVSMAPEGEHPVAAEKLAAQNGAANGDVPAADGKGLAPVNTKVDDTSYDSDENDEVRYRIRVEAARAELTGFWAKCKHRMAHPLGVRAKHRRAVRIVGQIGFVAKGVVYAIIGGLACQSGAQDESSIRGADVSPQGAFILVGNSTAGVGYLVVMAVGVLLYSCWRYWEGITGQGSDASFGPYKNFFRYRLSSLVSGGVYTAYAIFVLTLIPKASTHSGTASQGNFPSSWTGSGAGNFGLAVFGIAFLIAFICQVENTFTRKFHYEMKDHLPKWLIWFVIVTGHIGFCARAGVFLFVAIMFFRTINSPNSVAYGKTTIGNALEQLEQTRAGRAVLVILGVGLIIYGTFAVFNAYTKIFPTPPPSGHAKRASPRAATGQHDRDNKHPTAKRKLGAPAWAHKGTRAHLDDGHTAPTVPVRRGSRQRVIDFFNWGVWGVFGDSHKTLEYGPRKQEPDAAQKDIEQGVKDEVQEMKVEDRQHQAREAWNG
eukprot:jgi/Astpho2/569/Aster-04424